MLIVIVKQSNASCLDSIPIKAYKNALIVADSLDRLKKENAALNRLDSISNVIIDTLVKSIQLKDRQYKISLSVIKDCQQQNTILANRNDANVKAFKRERFWKKFFILTTIAAGTIAAIK